ncbi:sigma-70 family RNA polymerase sigma factor [Jeongeupia wiesaeckerbachi]|uniref:sigma-70 family RNA polymerase sigma factor n=1 Tax=Jeongeupia wiesaeckerbachi TaxID=3051218 RepID=UPI003D809C52
MTSPDQLTTLLGECSLGRQRALETLYRLTSAKLFAVALRILRRRDWAEEVLQECYVSIWQHANRYDPLKSQPMTWMTRIVRNRCFDRLDRPNLEVPAPDDDFAESWADDAPGPMALLLTQESSAQLAGCLKTLDGNQRQAIALAFFEGLSHSEVAQHLSQPIGTIKSWVRRGLDKLKGCLG